FIIEKILAMDDGRARLRQLGQQLARITGASSGHIQPFVTGSAESALALSSRLLEHGFKVLPIRTPTVPAGTERLRFSLSLDVTEADLERLSAIDLT
ncbi:MAG: aminotransferase class I/II-fold pyridoxal phosphate-dependent enzyme, partial [Muribaculaceae bacterium]|nr:aminotransferase class I/II-fold pyridoxal phosphate-dependent enzyme [Muribaculaceae bacterium]